MVAEKIKNKLTAEFFDKIFPLSKSDDFFDALYGDKNEGAYDITIRLNNVTSNIIELQFNLNQRPGKCLVCSLTYGLPEVFKRHPVINIKGLIKEIENILPEIKIENYEIGRTQEKSEDLHIIPFKLYYRESKDG